MDLPSVRLGSLHGSDRAELDRLVTNLYERRARVLVGLAMRLGLGVDAATDAVQEAHLRLWRVLCAGTVVRDPEAWLTRVVYRLAMSEHRSQRRLRGLVGRLLEVLGTQPGPAVALEGMALWQAVDRLAPRERATLYLRYQADLSFEAIGAAIGVAPGSARAYASRGLARLRASEGERPNA